MATKRHRKPAPTNCKNCGQPLTQTGRGRAATYCSNRCRAEASRQRRDPKPRQTAPEFLPVLGDLDDEPDVRYAPLPPAGDDWWEYDDLDDDYDELRPAPPRNGTELAARLGSQLTTIASRLKDPGKISERDLDTLIMPPLATLLDVINNRPWTGPLPDRTEGAIGSIRAERFRRCP